jgi:predicted small metal-binding protein
MKTMTCKQLGGPCETKFHANSGDEVIKAQDKHLKEMVAKGDKTHESALKEMQGRWKNPIAGMGWYLKTKKAFATLPQDK